MTSTDTLLEDDLWEYLQEAAGEIQVVKLPMLGGAVRPPKDYISMQMLDMIPEGREELLWSDGDTKFAIKQYYSIRFSFKGFGRVSKFHLAQTILKLIRDPYYSERLAAKSISPLGNPEVIDFTGLLTTEFESRCHSRVTFLVPVTILSDISCIEHIEIGASWVNIDDSIIRSATITVDKP